MIHNSGLTEGAGTADSFLKGSHVGKAKIAHQVNVCSLYILLGHAYEVYVRSLEANEKPISLDSWCVQREKASPHFKFWSITMRMEFTLLLFTRSLRVRNFQVYKDVLRKILLWTFALGHTHYSRWLSVHWLDMINLNDTCKDVYNEFENNGNFTVTSKRNFSAIAIEHKHEQNNKKIKGDGGAIGLTENSVELLRWMVCGPEAARVVEEFNTTCTSTYKNDGNIRQHHEQTPSVQADFRKKLSNLVASYEKLGNPFLEEGKELFVLDTCIIADDKVTDTINSIEDLGESACLKYIQDRLINKNKPISDTINKQNLSLFKTPL